MRGKTLNPTLTPFLDCEHMTHADIYNGTSYTDLYIISDISMNHTPSPEP